MWGGERKIADSCSFESPHLFREFGTLYDNSCIIYNFMSYQQHEIAQEQKKKYVEKARICSRNVMFY